MRRFVTDVRLARILDAIEKWQGCPIPTKPLPLANNKIMSCGIFPHCGGFTFHAVQGGTYSQAAICHELMHCCLLIEGWPAFAWNIDFSRFPWIKDCLNVLLNLAQHVEVWRRTSELGYSEQKEYTASIEHELIPVVKKKMFFQAFPQEDGYPMRAIYIAQALLSPSSQEQAEVLQNLLLTNFPKELELARSIAQKFECARPFSPQSCIDALFQSLATIKIQKEALQLLFQPRLDNMFLWKLFPGL
jgi:hypothetical protein